MAVHEEKKSNSFRFVWEPAHGANIETTIDRIDTELRHQDFSLILMCRAAFRVSMMAQCAVLGISCRKCKGFAPFVCA